LLAVVRNGLIDASRRVARAWMTGVAPKYRPNAPFQRRPKGTEEGTRQALHDRLMSMRNKIMAHSDSEMMRMTTQAFDVSSRDVEPPFYFIQTVFDEGITPLGPLGAPDDFITGRLDLILGGFRAPDGCEVSRTSLLAFQPSVSSLVAT
jgi:hypothetical protein